MKKFLTIALAVFAVTACSQIKERVSQKIKESVSQTKHLEHPIKSTLSFHETYDAGNYLATIAKYAPESTFLPGFSNSPMAGYVAEADTARFMQAMRQEAVRKALPDDCRIMLNRFKQDIHEDRDIYPVYLVKMSKNLSLWNVTLNDIYVDTASYNGNPVISMQFGSEDTKMWATMTRMNVGKTLAIVFNDRVLSAPRVNCEIEGGAASISMELTKEQADALVEEIISKAQTAE